MTATSVDDLAATFAQTSDDPALTTALDLWAACVGFWLDEVGVDLSDPATHDVSLRVCASIVGLSGVSQLQALDDPFREAVLLVARAAAERHRTAQLGDLPQEGAST